MGRPFLYPLADSNRYLHESPNLTSCRHSIRPKGQISTPAELSNLFTLCYESCGSAEFCYLCKRQTLICIAMELSKNQIQQLKDHLKKVAPNPKCSFCGGKDFVINHIALGVPTLDCSAPSNPPILLSPCVGFAVIECSCCHCVQLFNLKSLNVIG